MLRCDGDVVELAEPHRARSLSVVSRGTQRRERDPRLPGYQRSHHRARGTAGVPRGTVARRVNVGVGIDQPTAVGDEPLDHVDQLRVVDALQFGADSHWRDAPLPAQPVHRRERAVNRINPLRRIRMLGDLPTRIVIARAGMLKQQTRACDRLRRLERAIA